MVYSKYSISYLTCSLIDNVLFLIFLLRAYNNPLLSNSLYCVLVSLLEYFFTKYSSMFNFTILSFFSIFEVPISLNNSVKLNSLKLKDAKKKK